MSKEHERPHEFAHEAADQPYFQHHERIGRIAVQGEVRDVGLRMHIARERYAGRREIVPLTHTSGTRTYVHARPYVWEPDIRDTRVTRATVALAPGPHHSGEVGRVIGSQRRQFRGRDIGNAQAWLYHEDQTLVLWECFLEEWACAQHDPADDPAHVALWSAFERSLLQRLGAVAPIRRVVTPSWEPLYESQQWRGFLRRLGYEPLSAMAFGKAVYPAPVPGAR